jgi:hypothetical protein
MKKEIQNLQKKIKTKNSELYDAGVIPEKKSTLKSVLKLKKHTSAGKDEPISKTIP